MPAGRKFPPLISVRARRVWRCIPTAFANTALESGPSFTKDRRYSVQGEFGAVYLSGSKDLARLESDERGGEDLEPMSYLAFDLTLDRLVDLRSPKTREHFGVRLEDLVRFRMAKDRYEATQTVARKVYGDRLGGIIAPSVHDPHAEMPGWWNVVLYPAHLMLRFCLRPAKGV